MLFYHPITCVKAHACSPARVGWGGLNFSGSSVEGKRVSSESKFVLSRACPFLNIYRWDVGKARVPITWSEDICILSSTCLWRRMSRHSRGSSRQWCHWSNVTGFHRNVHIPLMHFRKSIYRKMCCTLNKFQKVFFSKCCSVRNFPKSFRRIRALSLVVIGMDCDLLRRVYNWQITIGIVYEIGHKFKVMNLSLGIILICWVVTLVYFTYVISWALSL